MGVPFGIMLITDGGSEIEARLERALAMHRHTPIAVQLRHKHASRRETAQVAVRLRKLTQGANGTLLLINGRVDVALEVGADGVHLPAQGLSIALARALMPTEALIGVSCHSAADVAHAARAGASYGLLSPIHPVENKAPAIGVAGFAQVAAQTSLPLLALGGVRVEDVLPLRGAGACGIAIMRSVMCAPNPAQALASYCDAWRGAAP